MYILSKFFGSIAYCLCDPTETDPIRRVRYIGITTQHPAARLGGHIGSAYKALESTGFTSAGHGAWIRSLVARGLLPTIEILAWMNPREAGYVEESLISQWEAMGASLTNSRSKSGGFIPRIAKRKRWESNPTLQDFAASTRTSETKPTTINTEDPTCAFPGPAKSGSRKRRQSGITQPNNNPARILNPEFALALPDAAQYLNLSVSALRAWIRQGRIPHIRCGCRILFDRQMIDERLRRGGQILDPPGTWSSKVAGAIPASRGHDVSV